MQQLAKVSREPGQLLLTAECVGVAVGAKVRRGGGCCLRDAEQSQVHAKFISGESAGSKTRLNAKIFAKCHCQCPAPHRTAPPHPAQFPHSPISELPTPPAVPFVIIICAPRQARRGRSCPRRKLYLGRVHLHAQCSAKVCVHTHTAHGTCTAHSFLSLSLSLSFSALRFLRGASRPLFWLMQIFWQPFAEANCDSDFTQRGAN